MVAAGGAIGAVFVGFFAPQRIRPFDTHRRRRLHCPQLPLLYRRGTRGNWQIALSRQPLFILATRFGGGAPDVVRIRNFYGALQVIDAGAGDSAIAPSITARRFT